MLRSFWYWLSGINEYYNGKMFFKEFIYIILIYATFAAILLGSLGLERYNLISF